ncbi:protein PML-like [Littorina saxatilis]|uniref:Exonuclease domain-containing protein n=1 Tax=Littorina saxatilis TaxID=31220 RepID=A0AAN9AXR4_9CAEN
MAGATRGAAGGDMDGLLQQLDELRVSPADVQSSGASRAGSSPSVKRPEAQPVDISGRHLVYFDLETTGLGLGCHITQIAAIRGNDTFSRFVLPKIPIDGKAQEITGITCQGNASMCHHGKRVECVSVTQALQEFLEFLGTGKQVLIGHNIKIFDCPRLLNPLRACDLIGRFQQAVHGFVDTLPLFRDFEKSLTSYRLSALYQHYFNREFNAHDAREDVKALQDIVSAAKVPLDKMSQHSFTLTYVTDLHDFNKQKWRLLKGWIPLVDGSFITEGMAEKAAGSGLKFEEVRRVFQQDGREGVKRTLLLRTDDGKPRVTHVNKTLDGICQYLESTQMTATISPPTTTYTNNYPHTTASSLRTAASFPRTRATSTRTAASSTRTTASSLGKSASFPRTTTNF